jgi:hypothetical protein
MIAQHRKACHFELTGAGCARQIDKTSRFAGDIETIPE